MKTCCFTGHRPQKLHIRTDELRKKLTDAINEAVAEGYTTFITGMAPGTDLIAGDILVNLGNPDIKLICAVPYPRFPKNFEYEWREMYERVKSSADEVHFICKQYKPDAFHLRNEWMVDRSSLVISVYNGERGGTLNTINYAERKGVRVKHLLDKP